MASIPDDFQDLFEKETGAVDPTPMTTHEFHFDEIEEAFQLMENKEDGIIKPLIHFD